jgi:hypothetical protein
MTKAASLSADAEAAILARYVQAQREEAEARDLLIKRAKYKRRLETAWAKAREARKKRKQNETNRKQTAATITKVNGGGVAKPNTKAPAKTIRVWRNHKGKKQ